VTFTAVPPGHVRTSPFVRVDDASGVATELVTGRRYPLTPDERATLARCAEPVPIGAIGAAGPALRERLLLLDALTLAAIGERTLGAIDLEVAGSCNAECVFCPRDELRHGRGVGIMREATFQRVLEVFGPHLRFVGFAGIGEPTLNKALPRWIQALRARAIEVALVTNGSMLTDELIDQLLAAGVSSIQVSFNGHDDASRASYEANMVGLDHATTRGRVERLLIAARGRVPVYISAVETSQNAAALAGFVPFWRARGASAGVVKCHSRGGTIVELRTARGPAGGVPRCDLFASRAFVSWDGRVLACCHDIDGHTELGDVATADAAGLIARKLATMAGGDWFRICKSCDEPAARTEVAPLRVRPA
jgi:organic radical activating enzyme